MLQSPETCQVSLVKGDRCQLCDRDRLSLPGLPMNVHHLIPQSQHARLITSGRFTQQECEARKVALCQPCHLVIHRLVPNEVLADAYNTLDLLRTHDGIKEYLALPTTHPLNVLEKPLIGVQHAVDSDSDSGSEGEDPSSYTHTAPTHTSLGDILEAVFQMPMVERPKTFVDLRKIVRRHRPWENNGTIKRALTMQTRWSEWLDELNGAREAKKQRKAASRARARENILTSVQRDPDAPQREVHEVLEDIFRLPGRPNDIKAIRQLVRAELPKINVTKVERALKSEPRWSAWRDEVIIFEAAKKEKAKRQSENMKRKRERRGY